MGSLAGRRRCFDRDEAVDFAFAPIELDERTRGVVVSVLEQLVERPAIRP